MIWFDRYDLPNKFFDAQKKIDFASTDSVNGKLDSPADQSHCTSSQKLFSLPEMPEPKPVIKMSFYYPLELSHHPIMFGLEQNEDV